MNLKKTFLSGINWSSLSFVTNSIIQLLLVLLLAKALSPEDFGYISIYLILVNFFTMLSEFGLSTALIQKKELRLEYFSSILFINIFIGVIFAVIFYFISDILSYLFFNKKIESLIFGLKLLSINVFLNTILQIYRSFLFKQLSFRYISIIEILSGLIYTFIVSILVFIFNINHLAIVYALVARRCFEIIILNFKIRIPISYKKFKVEHLRELLDFGIYVMGDKLITFFANNFIINLVIGRYFGSSLLGQYTIANQLLIVPQQKISGIIARVSFPSFSFIQSNMLELKNKYLKLINYISYFTIPINVIAFFFCDNIIYFFYENKFPYLVLIIRVLSFVSILRFITTHTGPILYVLRKAKIAFFLNLINLSITCIILYLFKSYGFLTTLLAWSIVVIIISIFAQSLVNNYIAVSFKNFIYNLKLSLWGFLALIISGMVFYYFKSSLNLDFYIIVILIIPFNLYIFYLIIFKSDPSIKLIIKDFFPIFKI